MRYRLRNPFSERLERAIALTSDRSFFFRYGVAVATCILVTTFIFGARALVGTTNPYLFLLAAVLLSSWYGGTRPGFVAFLYTVAFAWFTYISPALTPGITLNRILVQTFLFIIESIIILALVYRRNKNYVEMQVRTAQQAVIATIGQYGLEQPDLKVFMQKVVEAISRTVSVDYCEVLELLPDGKSMRLKSGTGWKKGLVGKTTLEISPDSHVGYILSVNKPVVVSNLLKERRFKGSQMHHEHNVASSISVVISGTPRPYGILSVHSQKPRLFSRDDVNFITAMANVLATTIERRAVRQELELMAKLNSELVSSLDPHQTVSGVVSTLVPEFAEICEVYITHTDAKTSLFEVKAVTKDKERLFKEMGKKYPPTDMSKRPTAKVLRSGKPILMSIVPTTYPEDTSQDESQRELFKQLRLMSLMVVPIKVRHKILGTIGFGTFDRGHIFTERDLILAKEIANRVAVALDNATLYQEAKNAIQARDEFLSIASHELKTPLTSMLLQLQAVLHSIKSESLASFSIEKTMTMLESTIMQSRRLTKLVNDLLNISLITTGRLQLEKEKTDLSKIVREAAERLMSQAEKAKSPLTIHIPHEIIGNWDTIRMEQVVTNLLTNAIKYGNGKPITLELVEENKCAILRVIDHGLGIAKNQQEKIFIRFQRGDVKSSIKGLGVGLYIVNEIVRAHGGKIGLTSKLHAGSVFIVELPLV